MHKNIKRFTQSGEIRDDADFLRLRSELERLMIQEMKDEGYLPILELSSQWSTKRIINKYEFKLSIYGAFAGKVKAQEYVCWNEGKLIRG